MNILFYRYGSICEPDIINAFTKLGLNVLEEISEVSQKDISASERVSIVNNILLQNHILFVFSINFFPAIAEICHIHKVLYVCWTVDSPIIELCSDSITRDTNRIFLFDKAQYRTFAPYNSKCIFHLPLASSTDRFNQVTSSITPADRMKYSCDISFVGSLYIEKNPMNRIHGLPEYIRGYIDSLIDSSLKLIGNSIIPDALSTELIASIKDNDPNFYSISNTVFDPDQYIVAHSYLGMLLAEKERILTLNSLARYFNVDLFTRSDTSSLVNVCVHDGVQTLTEMPKIFNLSKINLNMTIRPIQTGLPLRIFDILGCGGFLITNYQEELSEHFRLGTDLETYSSIDELLEKCNYYLTHNDVREKIASNGLCRVREHHTYYHRIKNMLEKL